MFSEVERCNFPDCRKKIKYLGFCCRFCRVKFCIRHQLPEIHECDYKNTAYFDIYKQPPKDKIIPLKSSERDGHCF